MILHINQCQKVVPLDQLGILSQDLPKLNGRHILVALSAKSQSIVIFPYRLINGIQLIRICLETADVFIGNVACRLQVLTDNPLT